MRDQSRQQRFATLERRYRALLRAYPKAYRADRKAEITATYLDLAGPDRRWPSPVDACDAVLLSAGGRRAPGLPGGPASRAPGDRDPAGRRPASA